MKLSVCVDSVFEGTDFYRATELVRECGIGAVEFWGWWNRNLERFGEDCRGGKIVCAALCTKFISLTDERLREDYLAGLKETIAVADTLNCKTIISQVGSDTGAPRAAQHASLAEGLRMCAPVLEAAGKTLVIEPLNTRVNHPGYYLTSSDECVEILNEVGSSNVKMLFDVYHQQISEGDICSRIEKYIEYIGHFHTAGIPGRHELQSSELNYKYVFDCIKAQDYNGYVGLEYFRAFEDYRVGTEYARAAAEE